MISENVLKTQLIEIWYFFRLTLTALICFNALAVIAIVIAIIDDDIAGYKRTSITVLIILCLGCIPIIGQWVYIRDVISSIN